jgi:hypothetical protein
MGCWIKSVTFDCDDALVLHDYPGTVMADPEGNEFCVE